jgi:outer membrane protein assembly factor BamD
MTGQRDYRRSAVPPFRRGWGGLLSVLVGLISLWAGPACSGRFDPSLYPTPEELFQASLAEFHDGDCDGADIGFRRLAFELPARDPKRAEVRYYLAECSFKRKEYLESSRDYRRVADENARDSLAPHALLRSGDAYSRLWRRPELDATYGLSALTTYQELLRRYPNSPAATEGRERILELNEWFAKKAFKSGIYYYRLKAFDSAIIYFKSVVADFPATSYASQSLVKLVEAYDRIGYEEDREDMCMQIRRFYPETLQEAEPCLADTAATVSRR